jgi:8-oxo-dGTP pyrophosphatase MutT (NUDIX family)
MEPHGERLDMPPLPSATVVLLRDGPGGLEAFLLERHGQSDVLGGAYVFPGGKLDRHDAELAGRLDLPEAVLDVSLGEDDLSPREAAGLYVAAIREVFEETGVLFTRVGGEQARAAWASLREGVHFDEIVTAFGTPLQASLLSPWSRWITPIVGGVVRKRFDTRFFVAPVPAGQEPGHDNHEAVDSVWIAPRAALRQYWEGAIALAPPQIMTLAQLSRHADVASAVAHARSRPPALIQPHSFELDGTRAVCYPGDVLHPVKAQTLAGPTRLIWRNGRFEPEQGFDALFT